jgi:hypothetical protein
MAGNRRPAVVGPATRHAAANTSQGGGAVVVAFFNTASNRHRTASRYQHTGDASHHALDARDRLINDQVPLRSPEQLKC